LILKNVEIDIAGVLC